MSVDGIQMRRIFSVAAAVVMALAFMSLCSVSSAKDGAPAGRDEALSRSTLIVIENGSFEVPVVDPNGFPALPYMEGWIERDVDAKTSTNTGVFANTPPGSPDRMENADGNQLAFLGSQQGNGLWQDVAGTYKVDCAYRLTVGVGISQRFPPSGLTPVGTIELVLYWVDGEERVDIVREVVEARGLSSTRLQDFSVYLRAVQAGDAWAGKGIGVAIRATGVAGGFWDLDHVRLTEVQPALDFRGSP